jgi:hypothetical protein
MEIKWGDCTYRKERKKVYSNVNGIELKRKTCKVNILKKDYVKAKTLKQYKISFIKLSLK